jgi:hypothetical protein
VLDYIKFACSRRLKRIKLAERNVKCIWRNTPSPSPDAKRSLENGNAYSGKLQNGLRQDLDVVPPVLLLAGCIFWHEASKGVEA